MAVSAPVSQGINAIDCETIDRGDTIGADDNCERRKDEEVDEFAECHGY